jgi:hypothetical protein
LVPEAQFTSKGTGCGCSTTEEFIVLPSIVTDPDSHPHHFENLDPDPDPHESGKLDPDRHLSEKVEALEGHFGAMEGPNLE